MTALLRYHFKIEPENLSDEEFIKLWNEYVFCTETEKNRQLFVLRKVASEIFGKED